MAFQIEDNLLVTYEGNEEKVVIPENVVHIAALNILAKVCLMSAINL